MTYNTTDGACDDGGVEDIDRSRLEGFRQAARNLIDERVVLVGTFSDTVVASCGCVVGTSVVGVGVAAVLHNKPAATAEVPTAIDIKAVAGIVKIHAQTILPATPQRTALAR